MGRLLLPIGYGFWHYVVPYRAASMLFFRRHIIRCVLSPFYRLQVSWPYVHRRQR